jgi:Tfp pilus assembly protein PilX
VPDITPEGLTTVGVTGILALLVVAMLRGWIVPGYRMTELVQEREQWRTVAEMALKAVEEQSSQMATIVGDVREMLGVLRR